jgi:SAM-dependent methyltransferase
MNLVNSLVYPSAVEEYLLENNQEDKEIRAYCFFEFFILENVSGLNIYNYSKELSYQEEGKRRGGIFGDPPYDIIILFDVLDHARDPVSVLKECKEKLIPGGKMYVRCHPWCSRSAAHCGNNKAYSHLVFTEKELNYLNVPYRWCNKDTIPPLEVYSEWFKSAGLKSTTVEVIRKTPEKLFYQNKIYELFPAEIRPYMDIQYIDYTLHD